MTTRWMRWSLAALVAVAACGDDGPDGSCENGEMRACYSGPEGTEGVGSCAAGIEICVDGEFPGICVSDITPFVENCNGVDDDCNGVVDDASGTGNNCMNADDCAGTTACIGDTIGCVGPVRNACDVCGGVALDDLGDVCAIGSCSGELTCNTAGDATECDAPAANICGLCGGPALAGKDDDCNAASGCAGLKKCSEDGDALICDCNPEPGMCRENGVFRPVVAPVAGDLIITEVMPNPSGDEDLKEWFEVEVKTAVDLNQLGLDRAGDNNVPPDVVSSRDCIRVAPGDRLVFARSAVAAENGNLPPVTATFSFTMVNGSAASPGDVQLLSGGVLVDKMTWTSTTTDKAHQLDLGTIDHLANDLETNICDAVTVYDGTDFGTPGAANVVCPPQPGECLGSNGFRRAIDPPAVGELVITEVMPSPSVAVQEWFEVQAVADVDLNNLQLDRVDDTSAPNVITSTTCIRLLTGARAVFARNADPQQNGGLPAVAGVFSFTLVGGTAADPGDVRVAVAGTTIDAITWTSTRAAKSHQLDRDSVTSVLNDLEANFCDATALYNAADFGTPGLQNNQCLQPGECFGASGKRTIVKPIVGQLVITEYFANPFGTGTDATQEWFEITNLGPDPFDLNNLGLKGNAVAVDVITSDACLPLAKDAFAVFAHTTDGQVNGGLTAVAATFDFAIAATNGSLSVLDGANTIDQTTWPTSPSVPEGVSRQLDPTKTTSTDNDVEANFCDAKATQIYGSVTENVGTPGVANVCL